ncbi:reverse transcriptase [Plakobranchus ocellatus]|uniref:Reverse transcriptase n=1 Tax=Plakobranchus ocellatus TaxID=259542 RepID=A0AAV4BZJ2_9GAST|nr:reverse transcriptase [Plakobranchus ocellatus]
MYCLKAKLKLSLKPMVEKYKYGKARLMTMLEDSEDPAMRSIHSQLRTGRKWKIDKADNQAKEGLKMKEVMVSLRLEGKDWNQGE